MSFRWRAEPLVVISTTPSESVVRGGHQRITLMGFYCLRALEWPLDIIQVKSWAISGDVHHPFLLTVGNMGRATSQEHADGVLLPTALSDLLMSFRWRAEPYSGDVHHPVALSVFRGEHGKGDIQVGQHNKQWCPVTEPLHSQWMAQHLW
jgi:hypothetical protein